MEEKRTMRTKSNGSGHQWISLLIDGLLGSVHRFVDGALDSLQEAAQDFGRRMAQRAFIFFLSIIGITFLLFGVARVLSAFLRMPGIGETTVGVFILLVAFIFHLFTREGRG